MRIIRGFLLLLVLTGVCFAACPSSMICPSDGTTMYPTGKIRFVAGHEEHEYAHTVWGPYDPTKPPAKHTEWMVCKAN